ncbi:MAG: hypothetical protein JRH19_20280 [Deltaproteobacteria bacterium]|nr:hypothetical protein [Deltaproteobacteria bacterium]
MAGMVKIGIFGAAAPAMVQQEVEWRRPACPDGATLSPYFVLGSSGIAHLEAATAH